MRLKFLLLVFTLAATPAAAADFADSIKADYDKRLGAMRKVMRPSGKREL